MKARDSALGFPWTQVSGAHQTPPATDSDRRRRHAWKPNDRRWLLAGWAACLCAGLGLAIPSSASAVAPPLIDPSSDAAAEPGANADPDATLTPSADSAPEPVFNAGAAATGARSSATPDASPPAPAPTTPTVLPRPATTEPTLETPVAGSEPVVDPAPISKLEASRSVLPFWFNRKYDTHHTRALSLPPLFIHRTPSLKNPEKLFHLDPTLTLGFFSKRSQKRRWINPAVLYFGAFSDRKSSWAALPLLMGYKRVGEKFNFGQFPLAWWWGNKHVKNLFVFPLHYQQKNPTGFHGMSGLLAWYGHKHLDDNDPTNDRRYVVVAPLFVHRTKGPKRINVAPLYLSGRNDEKGIKYRTLLPLFHWQSREFGNRKALWTPLWVRRSDQARRKQSWSVPLALSFGSKTPERDIGMLTPLAWRSENHLEGRKTWLLGPLGLTKDPRQINSWGFPLWWRFHDLRSNTRRTALFPLFHAHRGPSFKRLDTPIFSWRRDLATQKTTDVPAKRAATGFGIHPLLSYAGTKPNGLRYQFLAGGLFWNFTRPATTDGDPKGRPNQRFGIGPLFYGARSGSDLHLGAPPLLSFAGRKGDKRYQVITPLFWHVNDADREHGGANAHDTWVLGPAYYQKRSKGFRFGIPPLIVAAKDESYNYWIAPLALSGHVTDKQANRAITVSPFYVSSRSPGQRTTGAAAIFWDIQRKESRHSALFPLYYRRQTTDDAGSKRVLTLTPLGGALRHSLGNTWVAGPVYREHTKTRSAFGILPLVYHENRLAGPNRGSTSVVVPLYIRDRRPQRDLDMFTPFVWRSRVRGDKPYTGLSVVPFYFRMRQPGGVDVDAGLPWFYSRDATRQTHTFLAGTFFHRLTRTRLDTGLAPLLWWSDSDTTRRLIALPLIFHNKNKQTGEHLTVGLPVWFDRKHANGNRTWFAFPFVMGLSGLHNHTRFSVVAPGFFDVKRLRKNYRFTGVIPLLFRHQKCGFREEDDARCRYTLWGSFPLFFAGKDGYGRRTHSFGGLYWYDRDTKGRKLFTLLGGVNYRPQERLQWYAGPLYQDTTATHKTTALFPFFLHKRHRSEDRSTTLVLPPLYFGQHKEDRRWFQAALMLWHFRSPHKITTVVLPPLIGHHHAYAQRKAFWIAPLFVRDNNMAKDEAWTSVPPAMFIHHRKGPKNAAVQFPLLWHFSNKEKQRKGTIGAFLWYDFTKQDRRFAMVPGLYAHRSTPVKKTHVVGPGLAWWSRNTENAPPARDWKALFGIFGGGRELGQRYMTLFGARINIGDPLPAKTLETTSQASETAPLPPHRP